MKQIKNILFTLVLLALPASFAQGNMKTVSTLGLLPYVQPDPNYPNVFVSGWATANDGGWGIYQWKASSSLTTNYSILASIFIDSTVTINGVSTTISGAGQGGQWIRAIGGGTVPPQTQTLAAATTTKAEAPSIAVAGTSGATTITATPAIAANGLKNGQELTIVGTSDTDTVIYSDNGTIAGSKLELGAATRTLGVGDVLRLKYYTATTSWTEISFANN